MLVSYIIPVYNVERYLYQCVDSLLCQTYSDIEVILVDDGSPDGCGSICDEYAMNDKRVRVIHKANGGLSDARNAGLHEARGEYIIFVDGDDFWASKDDLRHLVEEATLAGYPDMVAFNICYYYPSSNSYTRWVEYNDKITNESNVERQIVEIVNTGTMPMSACSKMIKRDVYRRSGLQFIKGITAEDIPWFVDLLQIVDSVKYVNRYVYCYRCEVAGSITHTFKPKGFVNLVTIICQLVPRIESSKFADATKAALLSFVAYELCIAIGGVHRLDGTQREETRRILRNLTWLFKYTANPKVAKVSKVYTWLGYWPTEWLLRYYLSHRKA